MSAIHRARRGTFEVNALAVVAAAMARTFELVLASFPVRCAAEMRATSVNDKQAIRSLGYPDAILLLPFSIHPERVIAGRSDSECAGRFEDRSRQEKPQEH